jgi:hypothetical protein
MGITKKVTKPTPAQAEKAAEAFISGAPDAAPRLVRKGNKVQITMTISEPLLARLDAMAEQLDQTRAALISLAIVQMLDGGIHFNTSGLAQE